MYIFTVLSVIVLMFVLIGYVSAADIDVNDTEIKSISDNDEILSVENDLNILSDSKKGTYSDLRDEIKKGGKNIELSKSNYRYVAGDGDIIEIEKSCVIDGKGAVIDMAKSNIPAFYVGCFDVTIKNLTIKNVKCGSEAIYFSCDGTVFNCKFTNNSGGAIRFDYFGTVTYCKFANNRGGAVYFKEGGEVKNCDFTGNGEISDGRSAIFFEYIYGDSFNRTVTNCNFINNSAFWGGAIHDQDGILIIKDNNFINNSASSGGAIYGEFFKGNVTNCSFTGNKATYEDYGGGAIYFSYFSGTVTNCTFVNNHAEGNGGAMYDAFALNCTFINNSAKNGGAVFSGGVVDSIFNNNRANGNGGAVFDCLVAYSLFEYNSATNGGALSGKKATNCIFNKNTAFNGGAVYDASVSTNSIFNDNAAPNGKDTYDVTWFNQIKSFIELNLLINSNNASEIYLDCNYTHDFYEYGEIVINRDVTIYGNGFTLDGDHASCIFNVLGSNVIFRDIVFVNGVASCGGAVHGDCVVVNCSFINNSADNGGAMYLGSAVNCTFEGNFARDGGAMYNGSALNCNFTNNAAGNRGGAMYGGSAKNCTFINNCAIYGGAMFGGGAIFCILKTTSDTVYDTDIPSFSVSKSILRYDSGEKLLFNMTYNNENYDGYNITITLAKNGAVTGVYHALSGSDGGWHVNLDSGIYTATLSMESYAVKPVTIKITNGTSFSFSDLNMIINDNNTNEITLNNNFKYDSTFDFDYKGGIKINRNLTIEGNGITIDGVNSACIFKITGCTVIFRNITFANGKTDGDGGAIYVERGESTAINCSFINNSADNSGGAMYGGSAVNCTFVNNIAYGHYYTSEYTEFIHQVDEFDFIDSTIKHVYVNYDGGEGGAMYSGQAKNCIFINNSARCGGAMHGGLAIKCIFMGNVAKIIDKDNFWKHFDLSDYEAYDYMTTFTVGGGAMFNGSAVDCNFINNTGVGNDGGAMYWGSAVDCNFINNTGVGNDGGAMYWGSAVNCNFTNNSAWRGGAMYGGSAVNCNFINNYASSGGAIYNVDAVDCMFVNNSVACDGEITASPNKVTYKAESYYKIIVHESGNLAKDIKVVVKMDGKPFKTLKTNANGMANFKITKIPGLYKLTISALGKTVTKTLTVKHLVTLKSATVKKSAKKLVLTATLGKINGKYLCKKTVTFKFNGKTYNAKTDKKGVAKVTVKSNVLKKLKIGKKVTYQASYLKDTVKKTAKVKK